MLIGTNRGARGQHLRIEDVFIRAERDSGIHAYTFSTRKTRDRIGEVCRPLLIPASLLLRALLFLLRTLPSSSSRAGDYERCDMRARYYEGAVGRGYVYIRFEMRDTFN